MKKNIISFILCSIVFIISCSKQNHEIDPLPKIINDRVVTLEQAKALSHILSDMIFTKEENSPKLRSSNGNKRRTIQSVTPIIKDGITVLYSANFSDNLGYLLFSADNNSFPIVSIVDSGGFDISKIDKNSPAYAWIEERKNMISENLKKPLDTNNQHFNLWSGIIPNDSVEIEISYTAPPVNPYLKARRQHSTGKQQIYPWTGSSLKWGQKSGSNVDLQYPYQGYLVGCPAVATGMLFYKHWHPSNYGYMYMPTSFNPNPPYTSTASSQMLSDLAHRYHNNYHSWSNPYFQNINSSGTFPINILDFLQKNGYNNAKLSAYNFETVYANIKNYGAVLLGGVSNYNNGHVWYSDGYYEQSWTVTQKKKVLGVTVSTKTWTEYADFLYMNWGWEQGQQNGWYDAETYESGPNSGNSNSPYIVQRMMYTDLYPTYN